MHMYVYIYMRVCFYLHMHLHTYNTDMYIHILRLHTHTCAYDSLDIFGIFLKNANLCKRCFQIINLHAHFLNSIYIYIMSSDICVCSYQLAHMSVT